MGAQQQQPAASTEASFLSCSEGESLEDEPGGTACQAAVPEQAELDADPVAPNLGELVAKQVRVRLVSHLYAAAGRCLSLAMLVLSLPGLPHMAPILGGLRGTPPHQPVLP